MEKNIRKTIALIGGTRGVGLECLKLLIKEDKYKVNVLARNPDVLKDVLKTSKEENINVVKGDVMNYDVLENVLKESEVVINCLGSTGLSDNLNICSKGTEVIISVMKKLKLKKMITCSSLGVGDSYDQCSYMTRLVIWGILSKVIADKDIQENMIKKSGLDFIIVRPPRLMDWGYTGKYRIGYDVSGGKISRTDVADWIVKNLFSDEFLNKTPSIVSI